MDELQGAYDFESCSVIQVKFDNVSYAIGIYLPKMVYVCPWQTIGTWTTVTRKVRIQVKTASTR